MFRVRSSIVVIASFVVSAVCVAADEKADKPVKLFDGKSLKGWEGNEKSFRVEEGAIVAGTLKEKIPRNEFLATEKEYGDFELRLKFKLLGGEKANAGVQIRSQRIPEPSRDDRLPGGYGRWLVGRTLRRVAAKQDPDGAQKGGRGQGAQAGQLERLPHSLQREADPAMDQRAANGRLHRARRQDSTARENRCADSLWPAKRGMV